MKKKLPLTEEDVYQGLLKSDPEILKRLLEESVQIAQKVVPWYQRIIHQDLPDELAEHALLSLLKSAQSSKYSPVNFRGYITRIVKRRYISFAKKNKKTPGKDELDEEIHISYNEMPAQKTFETRYKHAEADATECFERLNEEHKEIIKMATFTHNDERKSFKEIAIILTSTEGNVRARHHYYIDILRDCMKTKGYKLP